MNQIFSAFTSYIIPTIFVLGALVWIHELGHFLFAKLVGIRVERFSIGFPPRLFGKKIGDTDYCVSAIPFGGYVKMSGMIDESMDKDSIKGEPWEFMSKPVWARFLVIFAGPAFNILLAVAIFAVGVFMVGIGEPVGPVVGEVFENSPAESIGLVEGDVIQKVDGQEIDTWDDLLAIVHNAAGRQLSIEWLRDGQLMSSTVVPEFDKLQGVGLIGIAAKLDVRKPGPIEAIKQGWLTGWNMTKMMGRSFALMFQGEISFRKSIAGPVRIVQMTGESAKAGAGGLFSFMALLSLNLGLINLLPFPVLDGGHLIFLGIEGISRKPINTKVKLVVQQIGMALLLALMVFVIFNDVTNMF